jgi:hypothetical protein
VLIFPCVGACCRILAILGANSENARYGQELRLD